MGVDHEPLPSRLASRSSSDGDPVPKLSSYACARVSGDGLMVTGPSEVSGIGGIGMRGSPSSGSGVVRSETPTSVESGAITGSFRNGFTKPTPRADTLNQLPWAGTRAMASAAQRKGRDP